MAVFGEPMISSESMKMLSAAAIAPARTRLNDARTVPAPDAPSRRLTVACTAAGAVVPPRMSAVIDVQTWRLSASGGLVDAARDAVACVLAAGALVTRQSGM